MACMRYSQPQVVVREGVMRKWLHFRSPCSILIARHIDDVLPVMREISNASRKRGLHAAGFISYEAAHAFDQSLPCKADDDFPLAWFGLFPPPDEKETISAGSMANLASLKWESSITQDEYRRSFRSIQEYIRNGDTYQVNLTYRLRTQTEIDPWDLFARIAADHEAPYAAFVDTGEWAVCSASPELFFRLDGNLIESRPMKGTAARGLWHDYDRRNAKTLQSSEKERAENVMIVDMVRSDMGSVAQCGSVHVPSLFLLEKYPTVWQMTSTVRARTYEPLDRIFQALFPPASITGAPKRRTMEIIAEMESSPRRAYTGAIGFAAPGRRAQFNVAIRTILIHKASGCAEYGVGGGIVWDSDCEMEQSECATKARILLASVDSAFSLLESLLRLSSGGFHLLERHLERIEKSAEYFDWPVNLEEVRRQLLDLSQNLPPSPHKVRLLLSKNGCIECQAEPVTLSSPISRRKIALAHFPVNKSNPFLYHKTTNREVYEEALSKCPEYDDVILFNEDGEVTESTRANVLVEMDGNLYTPPVRCGLLAGTCRAWMLELRVIEERTITIDQLLQSRSVFLINSVRGMYGVTIDRDKRGRPSERDPKAVLQ